MNGSFPMALNPPQAGREATLRTWAGILISILFHVGVLSLPIAVSVPMERVCQRVTLVIEQAEESRERPVLEGSHNAQADKLPTRSPVAPETPQAAEAESAARMSDEQEPQEPEGPEAGTPAESSIPAAPSPAAQVQNQAELKRGKKARKHPVARPRNKPVVRETPHSTQPVRAETPVTQERHETAALGNSPSSTPTPAGEGSNAGLEPVDAPFGSRDGPRFMKKVLPRYPRVARELGKEGVVLLQLVIDERGRILDVQVLKRAGSGFDEEALRAVRDSTFSPAKKNGRPVMCKARLPIQFILRDVHND